MTTVVISGGFDPIHSGHISYINSAAELGDKLIVLLNSDTWLQKKKGKEFMPFSERKIILESIRAVDMVLDFEDDDLGSCINGLEKIQLLFPDEQLIFCNGGDRNKENIPEMSVEGVLFKFSVGGSVKQNSSSWILKTWNFSHEDRAWGTFYNLFESNGIKVKELLIQPKSGMSFQRHFKRNEIWLTSEGSCIVNYAKQDPDKKTTHELNVFDKFVVEMGEWHQIINPFDRVCKIIEIQYGEEINENDIERLYYYDDNSV